MIARFALALQKPTREPRVTSLTAMTTTKNPARPKLGAVVRRRYFDSSLAS